MFRRRRFGGRRRGRRATQWCVNGGAGGTYGSASGATITAGGTVGSATLIDTRGPGSASPPTLQRLRIERIVGDICLTQLTTGAGAPVAIVISCGIIILQGAVGGTVSPDPGNPDDAGMNWLWLHHMGINENFSAALMSPYQQLTNYIPDIRVKRILYPEQRLMFMSSARAITTGSISSWVLTPYLRTLISRVA